MSGIVQLLKPVSVTQACGEDLSFTHELDAIAKARICDDPTLDQGAWVIELREADWVFVAARCAQLIESKSKDLRLAVWLAEAYAKTRHFRGLGDGYALLAGLCEQYWDGLYPMPDQGEYEQRIGNLSWLLMRSPQLIKEMPATESASLADAEYCQNALIELERIVDIRLGADGPGFGAAKDALKNAIHVIAPLAVSLVANATGPNSGSSSAGGGSIQSRAQALSQLRLIAEFFRHTEPHSPVAYLADKAANWGELPLHLWLRSVIKDPGAIAQLEELLGSQGSADTAR